MSNTSRRQIEILHVDDEPDFADLTRTFLERDDDRLTVETVTSAGEGLQHLSKRSPDCIISDYDMPGMDGIEFLQTVREEHPDLPFILFTGRGSEAVASDAISADVTDYLQKQSGSEQYELLANRIRNAVHAQRETQRADRQERLMRLTEFAGDTGGFEIDMDRGDLLLTDGTCRLLGLADGTQVPLEEAVEFFHPDDQADIRQHITRAAETGEETRGTARLQTLNDNERLVDVMITPATGSGDVTTLYGAIHDITEERKRRQDLEQIETLFQHTQDSLFLIDVAEEFTVKRVNPAYKKATGLSSDQLHGQTPQEILGEQQGSTVERRYRDCVERREPLEYTEQLTFDGRSMQWETKIAPVVLDDSVEYIVGATRDVTDRKERERELDRLQQAINDANVPITLADPSQPDDPLVYVNNAFEEMTGYLPEEALGCNCRFLQGEDTDPEKVAALREAIDNEESISVELRNYRKDGTEFWNRLTVTPIYDDDDNLVRFLGTQEDVTKRKERERDLERTRDLLSEMEELAGIGAWEYDPNTDTLTNTVGARYIYGVDPESSLSLNEAFSFFHPEDREKLRARFEACLNKGEPYEMDARITTTEGTQRWVTAHGEQVGKSGSDKTVRGYVQDITEEKTRERQLIELNQALQDLLTAATRQEVADIGVRAARDTLNLQANAVHLREDGDTLSPVAQTDELVSLLDEVPSLSVADSIAGRVYQRGEPTVIEDVGQDPNAFDSETALKGHVYLPLAEHGVLIAGSKEQAAFDQQDLAVGELLAGNLVAALNRIEHEQTVSRQQQQLSLFFEESPLGAVQWDDEFRFERLNDRAEEILGYEEGELRGEPWETIVAEEDRDYVGEAVENLLAADGGTNAVNRNVRKDGETRICKWHNHAVTDADGSVQTIFSKFEDITGQEQRKQELERYERLIENLPVGVFRTTMDGEIIDLNEAAVDIYDAGSRAQLRDVGAKPLYADDADREELLNRLQETGRVENELIEFETLSGDRRFVRTTLTLIKEGERTYLEGILQDVTDQRELEREFAQIKTIAESLNDAVYVIDEHGQFTYVNNEFLKLTGYAEETVLGSTPALIKDKETVETAERQLGRLLSDEGPDNVTFETTIQPSDGDPIACEDHMGVLPYEGDNFNGSVGVLRDISGRKRRERELRRERDRLDEFASVVSHDLRNPLNVAQGNLELLEQECDTDKVEPIKRAHIRMDDLIDDLLTLARQGETVNEIEPVRLGEIAETAWRTVESPRASLHVETDRIVRCDPGRLQQLLENLYRNAVEHGGSKVTVTVGAVDDGFYVEDTGPGIPEDERDQVFEPGYSTASDGTGFGLRIVSQVAEAHGWTVHATESEAGGARFEVAGVEFDDR